MVGFGLKREREFLSGLLRLAKAEMTQASNVMRDCLADARRTALISRFGCILASFQSAIRGLDQGAES